MQKNNFTFLWGCCRDYIDYMCTDIKVYRNVKCRNKYSQQCIWDEKKKEFEKLLRNKTIGRRIFEAWLKNELNIRKNCKNYLIFTEDYLKCINWDDLRLMRDRFDIFAVLYIDDPIEKRMNQYTNQLEKYRDKFDLLISTDNLDATKYDISFFPLIYSQPKLVDSPDVYYDLSFVGYDKGREKLLREINGKAKSSKLKTFIKCYKERKFTSNKLMDYGEIIDVVKKSNCILEVVQKGQSAITLRTLEAVYYRKKLLTNNTNIKKYSFYDPRYIQIFTNIDEIDFDFVKEKININYKYHNECSPINLVRYIERMSKKIAI